MCNTTERYVKLQLPLDEAEAQPYAVAKNLPDILTAKWDNICKIQKKQNKPRNSYCGLNVLHKESRNDERDLARLHVQSFPQFFYVLVDFSERLKS